MRAPCLAGLMAMLPTPLLAQQAPAPSPNAEDQEAPASAADPLLEEGETDAQDGPTPPAAPALPARGSENAITQAEDAFGFSSGKETLGLYTSSNVRGFSPVVAGNVRIDGLYFDQVFGMTNRIREATVIRVGLSAHGVPFPAPTGIVDYRLYKPDETYTHSGLINVDSFGTGTIESDIVVPLDGERLSVGGGFYLAAQEAYDGTGDHRNIQGITLRWRPSPAIEIMPFWTRSEIADDERAPRYVPAGAYLPPDIPRLRYDGPDWADLDSVGITYGLTNAFRPTPSWLVRFGLFRSRLDDPNDFAQLLRDLRPDGTARRIVIADPASQAVSTSGELRVSRSFAEGPRRHLLSVSLRGRNREELYGGSDTIDFGLTRIGESFDQPRPDFDFGPQSLDKVRQWTGGVAYDGQWQGVGEISVGLARTDYTKTVRLPGLDAARTNSQPWLYYGSVSVQLGARLSAYASYTKGLEESGVAPDNAVNRNEPLPAILTTQREVGLRYALTTGLRAIASAFELKKPYYNLNQASLFTLLGDVRNRGIELSLSGALTKRLNIVAGAVLLDPAVTGEGVALGRVGPNPVGLPERTMMLNLDWRPPIVEGLSFDFGVTHTSAIVATRDNLVSIPGRTLIDLGGRYRFKVIDKAATLRVRMTNVTDQDGFQLVGAGSYDITAGRLVTAYIAVEF